MDHSQFRLSDFLLISGRVYLAMAFVFLVLYFVVRAIEEHKLTVRVVGYQVPIEKEEKDDGRRGTDD